MFKSGSTSAHLFTREFNTMLLTWMLTQSDEVLISWGVQESVLDRLRNIPIGYLKVGAVPIISFNPKALEQILKISEAYQTDQMLLDRAIRCGARHQLVHAYTGISRDDYCKRLYRLGYPAKPSGRISNLSKNDIKKVYACWKGIAFRKREPLRALCVLSEKTKFSLDRIWISCDGELLN